MSTVANINSNAEAPEAVINEVVRDVSGKKLEFDVLRESSDDSVDGLYWYKNEYTLLPSSVGTLGKLRTLKFFGNEVRLFPGDGLGSLLGLENLQVKVSSAPGINGLELCKFESLKELELSCLPQRPSVITMLNEISGLRCLTKLSVCHFFIRYLPPEIGCLKNLEFLDLSYNKMKSLPTEISYLSSLISMRVSNNKLLHVPSSLSALKKLEKLDLSSNRLRTLGSLELKEMHSLQDLNLQFNRIIKCFEVPGWICCNLEGNAKDSMTNEKYLNYLVEMDVYDSSVPEYHMDSFCEGSHFFKPNSLPGCFLNSRNVSSKRPVKRWKRRQYLQHRARQERLNNSRKWKSDLSCKQWELCENNTTKSATEMKGSDAHDHGLDEPSEGHGRSVVSATPDAKLQDFAVMEDSLGNERSVCLDASNMPSNSEPSGCTAEDKRLAIDENVDCVDNESSFSGSSENSDLVSRPNSSLVVSKSSCTESSPVSSKSKRHCSRDLQNPKPTKFQRPSEETTALCKKYHEFSFFSVQDHLPDGFYDAGRGRPFMFLKNYEKSLCLDSREVILLDREKDESLDAITLSALSGVSRLRRFNSSIPGGVQVALDNLQIASWLSLFVSDHFGGSDKSYMIERARKSVSASNYEKPFICTCASGNNDNMSEEYNEIFGGMNDISFSDITEKSLQSIKRRLNSAIVPIGALQFGICRHRALLLKYLCDRMKPPIPCELVRGYLDFYPHSWNVILIKRNKTLTRMIVDACWPHDIREEHDPEYFCRYIPLNRVNVPERTDNITDLFSRFFGDNIKDISTSKSIVRCKLGSFEAAAKIRTVDVSGRSQEDVRNFEFAVIGEVRMLSALCHPSIVKIYGHQISSKWVSSDDGPPDRRVMCSAIFMEYMDGGSLEDYIENVSKAGKKQVPVKFAVWIAKDVACALMELHSKHIIHRDIKSANILVNLDCNKPEGKPVVKLCDFDMAVPLRSTLHKCCLAHKANPPPQVCVGTPRWMAPEVLRAMKEASPYGLEADIWSYGCLILELLTLQIPYFGIPEERIQELLELGKRPMLTDELEALVSINNPAEPQRNMDLTDSEDDSSTLRFLIDLYRRCTDSNPANRPSAADVHESLVSQTSSYS